MDRKRTLFAVKLVRHRNRTLTEVAEVSFLDLVEVKLDGALSSLT